MAILDRIKKDEKLYFVFLVFLFIVSFAIPIIFAVSISGSSSEIFSALIKGKKNELSPGLEGSEKEVQEKDTVFPNAINISSPNSYISVASNPSLEASSGKDFIFSIWLKFKRLPGAGESVVIFSKYDERSASRKGYSFSLTNEQENGRDAYVPSIYWRDDKNGTWFTFPKMELETKTWTLFVISVREGKYLGLHSAIKKDKDDSFSEIKLLGGYELNNLILPQTKTDLEIGAFNSGKFRGAIGPVGIFNSQPVTKDLDEILKSLKDDPREIPDFFLSEEVGLWLSDGSTDSGDAENKISIIKNR